MTYGHAGSPYRQNVTICPTQACNIPPHVVGYRSRPTRPSARGPRPGRSDSARRALSDWLIFASERRRPRAVLEHLEHEDVQRLHELRTFVHLPDRLVEQSLEKRGFFAHPEIAAIIYGADAAAGAAGGGKVSRTGGGGR